MKCRDANLRRPDPTRTELAGRALVCGLALPREIWGTHYDALRRAAVCSMPSAGSASQKLRLEECAARMQACLGACLTRGPAGTACPAILWHSRIWVVAPLACVE